MSLLEDGEDSIIDIPAKHREKTDTLCFHFSWPIFLAVSQIFILVIIFGRNFSIVHPPDHNGLRCGVNNAHFGKGLTDNRNNSLLAHSGYCTDRCNGQIFMSYCIPKDRKLLKHVSTSFKISADFVQYYSFAFGLIGIITLISIPIYILFALMTSVISFFSLVISSTLIIWLSVYEIYIKNYVISFIILIFGLTYISFLLYLQKRILVISQILSVSLSIMKTNKTLFLVPFFVLFFVFLALIFTIFGILFSIGVSDPVPVNGGGGLRLTKHNSLNATTALFPIIGFWFTEFIFSWVRSAIALIVASSYFQKHIPTFPAALELIAHFHSGTMFFGSFIIFSLEQLSNFFNFVKQTMKMTKNSFVKMICKCTLNVCFCCVQFFGEINRLSLVYTAVKGLSFWDGCKKAANALKIESVLNLELLLSNIFLCVRLLLSSAALIAVFIYQQQIQLLVPTIPVIWIPMTVYLALASVDVTLSASCDTILMCLCEDAKTEGFHGPKDLEKIVDWLKEKVVQETFVA